MNMILCELKKIWNLKIILAIILFGAMFYLMFMDSYARNYPSEHPTPEAVAFSAILIERYGNTITKDEMEEFYNEMHPGLVVQANAIIAGDPAAIEQGITDYASLFAFDDYMWSHQDEFYDEYGEPLSTYEGFFAARYKWWNDPEYGRVLFKLQALESLRDGYNGFNDSDFKERMIEYSDTDLLRQRWHEIYETGESKSIIPWGLDLNLVSYTMNLSLLVVFTVIILHSPLITSDRLRNMRLLQYSSKSGRGLLGKQFATVVLSSMILTTALILISGALYSTNGTHIFWDSYMSSFTASFIISIPLTYGQYVIALVIMLYLLGIAVSAISFVLSRLCSNYISLIAGGICTCIAAAFLCAFVVFNIPFGHWINKVEIALLEPLTLTVLILLGFAASLSLLSRERRIDIA